MPALKSTLFTVLVLSMLAEAVFLSTSASPQCCPCCYATRLGTLVASLPTAAAAGSSNRSTRRGSSTFYEKFPSARETDAHLEVKTRVCGSDKGKDTARTIRRTTRSRKNKFGPAVWELPDSRRRSRSRSYPGLTSDSCSGHGSIKRPGCSRQISCCASGKSKGSGRRDPNSGSSRSTSLATCSSTESRGRARWLGGSSSYDGRSNNSHCSSSSRSNCGVIHNSGSTNNTHNSDKNSDSGSLSPACDNVSFIRGRSTLDNSMAISWCSTGMSCTGSSAISSSSRGNSSSWFSSSSAQGNNEKSSATPQQRNACRGHTNLCAGPYRLLIALLKFAPVRGVCIPQLPPQLRDDCLRPFHTYQSQRYCAAAQRSLFTILCFSSSTFTSRAHFSQSSFSSPFRLVRLPRNYASAAGFPLCLLQKQTPRQHPSLAREPLPLEQQWQPEQRQQIQQRVLAERGTMSFVCCFPLWSLTRPPYQTFKCTYTRCAAEQAATPVNPHRRRFSCSAGRRTLYVFASDSDVVGAVSLVSCDAGSVVAAVALLAGPEVTAAARAHDMAAAGAAATPPSVPAAAAHARCSRQASEVLLPIIPLRRSTWLLPSHCAAEYYYSAATTAPPREQAWRQHTAAGALLSLGPVSRVSSNRSSTTSVSAKRYATLDIWVSSRGSCTSCLSTKVAASYLPCSRKGAAAPPATAAATPAQQVAVAEIQHAAVSGGLKKELADKARDSGATGGEPSKATAVAARVIAECSMESTTAAACQRVAVAPDPGVRAGTPAASAKGGQGLRPLQTCGGTDAAAARSTAVGKRGASGTAVRAPGPMMEETAAPQSAGTAATTPRTAAAARGGTAATAATAAAGAVAVEVFRRLWRQCGASMSSTKAAAAAAAHAQDSPAAPAVPAAGAASLHATAAAENKRDATAQATTRGGTCSSAQFACWSCPSACWSSEDGTAEEEQQQVGAVAPAIPAAVGEEPARGSAGSTQTATEAETAVSNAAAAEGTVSGEKTAAPGVAATEAAASETRKEGANGESQQELLTERLRARMEKQGYKLVGTHSAVKLCRWTKKQLQGVGGCYKHTFYGIESHRCMEATTSLVCSNRCVFCWRHHTHPASKIFRWKADPPEELLAAVVAAHKAMIKPLKGMRGVTAAAYKEALQPLHCALSLIGEALMYPHINSFIELLHSRRISTFLVMNGQHPELLAKLPPVTQLYVSVDASSEAALKEIDRPLFADFWKRLLHSLDVLREKKERTVVRLTVIKDVNDEDVEGYARLIQRGQPDFVEVKGMTFAGGSANFRLTLRNTPHMQETVHFSQRLLAALRHVGCSSMRCPAPFSPYPVSGSAAAAAAAISAANMSASPTAHAGAAFVSAEAPNYQLASLHEHTNAVLLADANKFLWMRPEVGKVTTPAPVAPAAQGAEIWSQSMHTDNESRPGTALVNDGSFHAVQLDAGPVSRRVRAPAEEVPLHNEQFTTCKRCNLTRRPEEPQDTFPLPRDSVGAEEAQRDQKKESELHEWRTHIDFTRFFELDDYQKHAENYCARTPEWASPAAPLQGFDPHFDVTRYLQQIAGRPPPAPPEQCRKTAAAAAGRAEESST